MNRTPTYPKYSGEWDRYFNKFLPRGKCCVCNNAALAVMRLRCGHALCMEDVKGYLESALGDVSMFPVKCPMHYQGCEGAIDSRIAKRVLSEPQYNRFNEFCDRATYGDGKNACGGSVILNCANIFCNFICGAFTSFI